MERMTPPREIIVLPGTDKSGAPERFGELHLEAGGVYAVVGDTGSGKSRLIKDVEQLADGTSGTHRRVLVDGRVPTRELRRELQRTMIAHLSQSMRFVLDESVEGFVAMHAACRGTSVGPAEVVALANEITPEAIDLSANLNQLSGGQTRALMIADVALVCASPVVLVDEIENAGIDKETALSILCDASKLVLVVTHDPHTALAARRRIVMRGGAVVCVRDTADEEAAVREELRRMHERQALLREMLRKGEVLT